MSRLVLKRFPGESVVVDGGRIRLTVRCIRGDGPGDTAVTLHIAVASPSGCVSEVTFGLRKGQSAPLGAHMTVELKRAMGGRCWLLFLGPPGISIVRGELERKAPAAAAETGGVR